MEKKSVFVAVLADITTKLIRLYAPEEFAVSIMRFGLVTRSLLKLHHMTMPLILLQVCTVNCATQLKAKYY